MADTTNPATRLAELEAALADEKKKNQALSAAAEKSNNRIKELEEKAGLKDKKPKNTVQYVVLQDCYWQEVLWHEDDVVDIDENITPPQAYFEKVSK